MKTYGRDMDQKELLAMMETGHNSGYSDGWALTAIVRCSSCKENKCIHL